MLRNLLFKSWLMSDSTPFLYLQAIKRHPLLLHMILSVSLRTLGSSLSLSFLCSLLNFNYSFFITV